jgi:CBS domain-containing protein
MTLVDKAKAAAERAREQAKHGLEVGQARLDDVQERRQYAKLLQQLGEACYAEQRGEGSHETVVRALAAVDAHRQAPGGTQRPGRGEAAGRRARDIMHPGAECIGESDSLASAAQRMRDLGVGSLPICGADDRLLGILTDRDIVVKCLAQGGDPAEVRAGDLAQGTLFWVEATADVGQVLRQVEDHRIKRLPMNDNHPLVGMISEADLARNLSERQLAEFVEKVYAAP